MNLDLALVEQLMRMLQQSDLQELDVSQGGMQLRLAKTRRAPPQGSTGSTPDTAIAAVTPIARPEISKTRQIASGMAGTFYRSPKPGAEPFVREGASIREGDQLAIVEAMKMLNPVEADCAGTISRILLADGASVEPGTVLFVIETP